MVEYRLRGGKVGLRALDPADAMGPYYEWLQQPEVTASIVSQRFPISRDGLARYIVSNTDRPDVALFGICRLEGDMLVGTIRLSVTDSIARVGTVGVVLGDRACRGQGLASEALRLVLDYGFRELNLQKICAGVHSGNTDSLALFRKVMTEEAVLRRQEFFDGEYRDGHLFAVFRD